MRIVVARKLLAAGLEPLRERFEVVEGGLDATGRELLELAPGADALVADPTVPVGAELLDAAGSQLRVVANFAVGYDNVDLDACAKRGVAVTNTPDVLTNATAELAMALTLMAARRTSEAEADLRAGRWTGWDPGVYRGLELAGSTVGVIGMGRIGKRYAELARAVGAQIVYASQSGKPDVEERLGARHLELDTLLGEADVVSLHAPAGEATRHLIDARSLSLMKPEAILVNTARGSLVDSAALAAALREGLIAGAGLDVYEDEPEVPLELLEAPGAVLLPHIGSATRSARDAMARTVADNVLAALDGHTPPNLVA